FPGRARIAQARDNLAKWQEQFEREAERFPKFSLLGHRRLTRLAWGAGIAGCLAAGILVTQPIPPARTVVQPLPKLSARSAQPRIPPLSQPPEIGLPRRIEPLKRIAPPVLLPSPPPPRDVQQVEIEAYYGLHRFRACLGMPIEVVSEPSGCITIRGLVASAEQRNRLEAAFAQLRSRSCLWLELKTTSEAGSERPASLGVKPVAPVEVVGGELPLQASLEAYFTRQSGDDTAAARRQVVELANQAVEYADQLLAEAWALRRLAERFGDAPPDKLPAPAAWLLEVMVRDHLLAIREGGVRLHTVLGPSLNSVVSDRGAEAVGQDASAGSVESVRDTGSHRIFQSAQQLRGIVFALFARPSLAADRESANSSSESTAQAAGELLARMRKWENEVSLAAQALNADLSDRPAVRASEGLKE
ncbi:MAG: hypothetical protein ACRD7E_02845, partial [Bryobacteraceae bacterium]